MYLTFLLFITDFLQHLQLNLYQARVHQKRTWKTSLETKKDFLNCRIYPGELLKNMSYYSLW